MEKVTIVNKQGIQMRVNEKLAAVLGGAKPKILDKPPELIAEPVKPVKQAEPTKPPEPQKAELQAKQPEPTKQPELQKTVLPEPQATEVIKPTDPNDDLGPNVYTAPEKPKPVKKRRPSKTKK